MRVWKNRLAVDLQDQSQAIKGADKGESVYHDYKYMVQHLLEDSRSWKVISMEVDEDDLIPSKEVLGMSILKKGIYSRRKYSFLRVIFTDAMLFVLKKNGGVFYGVHDTQLLDKAAELSSIYKSGSEKKFYQRLKFYLSQDDRFKPFHFESKMTPSGKPCMRVGYTINQ